jgi:hypothetical protein
LAIQLAVEIQNTGHSNLEQGNLSTGAAFLLLSNCGVGDFKNI